MIKGDGKMRIQPVPLRNDRCYICEQLMPCRHVDHDFRGAAICGDVDQLGSCANAVAIAEACLRHYAKCAVPSDSILEDHGPSRTGL